MGKVVTRIKLTNFVDLERARLGELPPDRVRTAEVDALVDTGATMLVLPAQVVRQLGLRELDRRRVRYANGSVGVVPVVTGLQVEILGRWTGCDALVEAEGTTPLLGQIPMEALDLVVDPANGDVRVNPEHPDAPLLDLLHVA